jgi:ABC-2 type transport system permease protein
MKSRISIRRLLALSKKESLQILRDPSSNLIAFVLPVMLLFVFGYGISLDTGRLSVGLVLEDSSPEARRFGDHLIGSPYLAVKIGANREEMGDMLAKGQVRGMAVVPLEFSRNLAQRDTSAQILIVTDGAEPNTAKFVENYIRQAYEGWRAERRARFADGPQAGATLEPRYWFNPSAESRNFLIPGSITIIMTVIGALLTSMVVAREWERGTMEALLASPVTRAELLLSKLLPYYLLGVISLMVCVAVAVLLMHVPLRGSIFLVWLAGSLFLGSALGLGLLLSTVTRNQFNAAMAALNAAFLPALILSGFLYEIRSMPVIIQGITYLVPARYFVAVLQTLFQAGNVWPVLVEGMLFLLAASVFFLGLTALKTRRNLE